MSKTPEHHEGGENFILAPSELDLEVSLEIAAVLNDLEEKVFPLMEEASVKHFDLIESNADIEEEMFSGPTTCSYPAAAFIWSEHDLSAGIISAKEVLILYDNEEKFVRIIVQDSSEDVETRASGERVYADYAIPLDKSGFYFTTSLTAPNINIDDLSREAAIYESDETSKYLHRQTDFRLNNLYENEVYDTALAISDLKSVVRHMTPAYQVSING